MVFSTVREDNERSKFEQDLNDLEPNVRVSIKNDFIKTLDSFVLLAVGNKIEASYPSATVEVYQFKNGATLLYELTVAYTNASKDVFLSVERTA